MVAVGTADHYCLEILSKKSQMRRLPHTVPSRVLVQGRGKALNILTKTRMASSLSETEDIPIYIILDAKLLNPTEAIAFMC